MHNGTFSSILTTGLHRTESDLIAKHSVNQQVVGGNVVFNHNNFQVGATVVGTILSDTLRPLPRAYNVNYFQGRQQLVTGLHYRLRLHKLHFFGETAMTNDLGVATINGLSFTPISPIGIVLSHRYYSPRFDNFHALALAETSRVNNEQGFYLAAEVRALRRWRFAAYADSYFFPQPKYGIDRPSAGFDYLLQADYTPSQDVEMYWRLKWEQKEKNITQQKHNIPMLDRLDKASLRYQLTYTYGDVSFKNVLDLNLAHRQSAKSTYGFSLLQDVSYRPFQIPFLFDFRFQVFDARDYENRIYTYERDVLYAFSIPMYYGLGARYYLNIRYDLNPSWSFWLKLAQTAYADNRSAVSSGNEEIVGTRKSDIRIMIRWKV